MVGLHKQRAVINWGTVGGVAIMIAVAAVALVGLFFLQGKKTAIALLDPITFCPKDGATAAHVVLIDRTDPLTEIQLEALRKEVLRQAHEVPKHEAFRVYEIGHGGALLSPVVDVCNPGDGADASQLDDNPAKLRRRYQRLFTAPINKMISSMTGDGKMNQSPIMEAVQAISVRDFGASGPKGGNTLTIFSDLLQYSTKFSLYRAIPDVEEFAHSPAGKSLHSDLAGVDVTLEILFREKDAKFQPNGLGPFWVQWLERQSATIALVKQLPG